MGIFNIFLAIYEAEHFIVSRLLSALENSNRYLEYEINNGINVISANYENFLEIRNALISTQYFSEPNFYVIVENDIGNSVDMLGLSTDIYEPDTSGHGGPHVDRRTRKGNINVGRYNKDGSLRPPHKGKPTPPIPKSDMGKFNKAASKLPGVVNVLRLITGILEDIGRLKKSIDSGKSYDEQLKKDIGTDSPFIYTPFGPIPNPFYEDLCPTGLKYL